MAFLLVDIDGCEIAREDERIVVREGARVLSEHLPHQLECVVAWGRVEITRPAIDMLITRHVPVHLIGSGSRYTACILPPDECSVKRRRAQFAAYDDEARRLSMAKAGTKAELANLRTVVRRWGLHRPQRTIRECAGQVGELADMLEDATTLDEVRGIEGMAWRHAYRVLGEILPSELQFDGRKRRPAPDPVNAVLGLFGVITANAASCALRSAGLDAGLGFLHGHSRGGPALALDLADVYRPMLALAPAVTLFTKRVIGPGDFEGVGRSAMLSRNGMRKAMRSYAKACRREVRRRGAASGCGYLSHMNKDAGSLAAAVLDEKREWRPLEVR